MLEKSEEFYAPERRERSKGEEKISANHPIVVRRQLQKGSGTSPPHVREPLASNKKGGRKDGNPAFETGGRGGGMKEIERAAASKGGRGSLEGRRGVN